MGEPTFLADEQLRTLDRLRALPELASFYLAGGTAIAHHLRDRGPPRPRGDDDGRSPNVRELVMGVLFAGIGLFMLVMPKTTEKATMFVILGLVNITVGVIKIAAA